MKSYFSLALALLLLGLSSAAFTMEKEGQAVFTKHCSHCHAPGLDRPGTLQLSVTRGEAYALLEQRTDLNVDYIKYIVRHGLKTMPGFKPTTLTEPELDALADYLKQ
jgi:mono/diheme cytochrome c family protein